MAFSAFAAQLASYCRGRGCWSFFWNRRFTFGSTGGMARQAYRFLALQAFLALASACAIKLAMEGAYWSATPAGPAAMIAVTVANYVLCRVWAFRP